ncbi:MAG TPA: ABC transporter ATP-binding protein [Candidatus Baltobacteraceae bacterium]|nr:ABC transporter ATP-binding protein [Candidatus Baltobacteraceae bacterium]
MSLLEVKNLRVTFRTEDGPVTAVNGLSFDLGAGETLGIVGESGSGKSVTALSIMRLLAKNATVTADRIAFDDENLPAKSETEMRKIRGHKIAMIFQDPMTSLNPVLTIGDQIAEAVRLHLGLSKHDARDRAIEMLGKVRIPSPASRLNDYPHQFSGGMRQRVMIAMALSCNPQLLIADEPTTALDVTIQAQVLELMNELQQETGAAIILITHDLGVVAEVCDEVAVMYAGEIVERAPVDVLFAAPQHPYTVGLLGSIPRLDGAVDELAAIDGLVPNMAAPPSGCRFAPRCPFVRESCTKAPPPMLSIGASHETRCIRAPLEQILS